MSLTEFMKVSKIVTYSNNVHTYVNTKKKTYKEGLDCFMSGDFDLRLSKFGVLLGF